MRNSIVFKLIIIVAVANLITACNKDEIASSKVSQPTVTTAEILDITKDSAVSGGEVIDDGGAEITARGVTWSRSENPIILDSKTMDGRGAGTFRSNLTGLQPNKIYYVRSYAINRHGTGYGNQVSFRTAGWDHETGTVTDIDGNEYQTVKIGDQWWMAENLKVSKYRNGDDIPDIDNFIEWRSLSTGAWSNYNNDSYHDETYGKLYNWYTVDDERGLCPAGWHVPGDEAWKQLEMYLGMLQEESDKISHSRGTDEGDKMKSIRTEPDPHPRWDKPWEYSYVEATDESGFSGLPGGIRQHYGHFRNIGRDGNWWSSTEFSDNDAWYRAMYFNHRWVSRSSYDKRSGYSVRCLRDE